PHEAAYLAALPKEPSNLHPIRARAKATNRRNYVLREMKENGYLPEQAFEEARALPLGTVLDAARTVRVAEGGPLGFFAAEVRRQVTAQLGREELFEGGLTVRATVDPRLQAAAGRALRRGLESFDRQRGTWRGPLTKIENVPAPSETEAWQTLLARADVPRDIPDWRVAVVFEADQAAATIGIEGIDTPQKLEIDGETWIRRTLIGGTRGPKPNWAQDIFSPGDVIFVAEDPEEPGDWDLRQLPAVQGAVAAMDPETGRVLALFGGFSYDQSVFNRATQALRQPGSAFKPFVYAAALDAGYTPATVVNDAPVAVRLSNGETWRPKNSSGNAYGPTPMRRGLELSRNLMTVRIAQQVGMDRIATYAERFGVYENMPHHLAFALGAGETTLYNMVAAYGMFVNGGKRVRPTVIDRIQDRRGRTLFRHDPRGCEGCDATSSANVTFPSAPLPTLVDQRERIMNPSTAYQIVSMLEGVVTQGTANRTVGGTGLPLAGKTGTTNDSKDAWFIGFSPKLVAGCFIGFDNPTPMGKGAYGGTLCGPVFKEFMAEALAEEDPGTFVPPLQSGLVTVKIDRYTGRRLPDDASGAHVVVEVFKAGNEPILFAEASALAGDSILFGSDLVQGA
ncbi:MAG: penicillin-binding transpeptidase domain-containing protein, partial [Pseudomonadota bacterium]